MKIQKNHNLSKLNTFGISVNARFFVEVENEGDVKELFDTPEFKNSKKLFLGGGSNVLFTKDFDGLVILNKLKGIEILKEDPKSVTIRAMGGEIWHDLVVFATDRGLWGIENLSLIPGTVGAAPMQNIGAYGAELKDVLENVEAYEINTGKDSRKKIFSKEECKFGYRDSIFKNELKDKYFITAITIKLSKIPARNPYSIAVAGGKNKNKIYPALQEYLEKNKIEVKRSKNISDAVEAIRRNKLPDPAVIPNAGSFFKNVFVEKEKFQELLKIFPDVPNFEEDGLTKIPAGWLIEQCGWKGKKLGSVGVHEKQALVLVNYGGATGKEVKNLGDQIIASVFSKFGLRLSLEVNLI